MPPTAAASVLLLLAATAPADDAGSRCPAALPAAAQGVRSGGGGPLRESALNASEVVWVGPECAGVFVGSPSIELVPASTSNSSSTLLASHDFFGTARFDSTLPLLNLVRTFASTDGGQHWSPRGNASGLYWAQLFRHRGALFLLGVSGHWNWVDAQSFPAIATSTDGGNCWSPSAPLLASRGGHNWACGPTPVIEVNGRLYKGIEAAPDMSGWNFTAVIASADSDSDLLSPHSWMISNPLPINTQWNRPGWNFTGHGEERLAWQEGNAVEAPDGRSIWLMLRVNNQGLPPRPMNIAALVQLDETGRHLSFRTWVDGPFSESKFVVWREKSLPEQPYFAVSTNVTDELVALNMCGARNNLVLSTSSDLVHWTVCTTVMSDDTGFSAADSAQFSGFQYPDCTVVGTDLLCAIRTSYRGANSFHNSNRMTVKTISDFSAVCHRAKQEQQREGRLKTDEALPARGACPCGEPHLCQPLAHRKVAKAHREVLGLCHWCSEEQLDWDALTILTSGGVDAMYWPSDDMLCAACTRSRRSIPDQPRHAGQRWWWFRIYTN
jgi:hypothetical protein